MKSVYLSLEPSLARRGFVWSDDSVRPAPIDQLRLGPDDLVTIRDLQISGQPLEYSLAELNRALVDYDPRKSHVAFEERGQVAIGQHLYQETLGRLKIFDGQADVDLRIMTDDEHLGRLPWPLLAHRGLFLVNQGWSVASVTRSETLPDVELPPSPRLLMIVPQPANLGITDGDEHCAALRRLLGTKMADADHFHVAATWKVLQQLIQGGQKYDMIYYYGHGDGMMDQSRLHFAVEGQREHLPVAMRDFAQAIQDAQPKLVYLNCCSGDAGGLLGAGRQLTQVTPCVVTNRTLASVDAAQAQAMAFWRQVLLDGVAPHLAAARNYQSLGKLGLSSLDPHWFTPVIYANYRHWSSNPPDRARTYDKDWKLKLDRELQFGRLLVRTQNTLANQRPRALACFWFGEEGEGMTYFHNRLEFDLESRLSGSAEVAYFRTRWPDRDAGDHQAALSTRAFEEMLLEAFDVESLGQISGRVRGQVGNARAIVVVNHPHASVKVMPPQRVLEYLKWWNELVVPHLEGDEHAYLLGFSYRAKNVANFQSDLAKCVIGGGKLDEVNVFLLPPLLSLTRNDLLEFFQDQNIVIPSHRLNEYLDYILQRTKGRYEATIVELEPLVVDGYDEALHQATASGTGESGQLFAEELD